MGAENAGIEYDLTLHELHVEHESWMIARERASRAGGHDANLNMVWDLRVARMDYLLEEFFGKMGQLAIERQAPIP